MFHLSCPDIRSCLQCVIACGVKSLLTSSYSNFKVQSSPARSRQRLATRLRQTFALDGWKILFYFSNHCTFKLRPHFIVGSSSRGHFLHSTTAAMANSASFSGRLPTAPSSQAHSRQAYSLPRQGPAHCRHSSAPVLLQPQRPHRSEGRRRQLAPRSYAGLAEAPLPELKVWVRQRFILRRWSPAQGFLQNGPCC